jgi:hypothetical protein
MMNKDTRINLLIIIFFPLVGLILLASCFFIYFGIFSFLELVMGQRVPVGLVRQTFAIVIVLIYLLICRLKISEIIKALLMIGPLATLVITVILTFYQNLLVAIALMFIIVFSIIYFLYRHHKKWFYYYSVVLAVVAAIAYGWPR